ncbi:MAG: TonB-dependent receptor [Pseudomonadota bacterium]
MAIFSCSSDHKDRLLKTVSVLALFLPLLMVNTKAQEIEETSETGESTILDPITITARKKEEEVKDIPFGVSTVSQDELERAQVDANRDLARRLPNVFFQDGGVRGFNRLIIRGVGDIGGGFAPDDNSVGYFINGVPIPLLGIDGDLFDVERVEVLRGPQNVLFGRNAQGGAINVITKDPSEDPSLTLGVEFGNFSQEEYTAKANGAISDQASARIAAQFRTREGDIPNDIGDDVRGVDIFNVLGSLKVDLEDGAEVNLFVRYEEQDEDVLLRTFTEDPAFPRVRLDFQPFLETENLSTGLTYEKQFGDVNFTSVTGFYSGRSDFRNDQSDGRLFSAITGFPPAAFDNTAIDFAVTSTDEYRINQEFRWSGETDGIEWLAGVNLFYSDLESNNFLDITSPVPFFTGTFNSVIETQSYDAFGSVTVPVSDLTKVSGELRYTFEEEEFSGGFIGIVPTMFGPFPSVNQQTQRETFDFVTGRVSIVHELTPDTNIYATYARGAKAGGFSNFDTNLPFNPTIAVSQFDTAQTDTYEAGFKSDLYEGALTTNLSVFFNSTQDEQLAAFDFATFTTQIVNADAETYGAELDLIWRPTDSFLFQGALGLLETEITAAPAATGALVGGDVPNAPDVTLSLVGEYTIPIDNLSADLILGAEYQYVGSRIADIGNTISLDSYEVVNLRAELAADDWKAFFVLENAFDEVFATAAFPFGTTPAGQAVSVGGVGLPRKWVVGAQWEF